jgi:hypothetical protein
MPYRLTLEQRPTLFRLLHAKEPINEIARQLGRRRATLYRELRRNLFRAEVSRRKAAQAIGAPLPSHGTCTVADLWRLVALDRTFGCIYADPPWLYDNQGTRATSKPYTGPTVVELAELPSTRMAHTPLVRALEAVMALKLPKARLAYGYRKMMWPDADPWYPRLAPVLPPERMGE